METAHESPIKATKQIGMVRTEIPCQSRLTLPDMARNVILRNGRRLRRSKLTSGQEAAH